MQAPKNRGWEKPNIFLETLVIVIHITVLDTGDVVYLLLWRVNSVGRVLSILC